MSTIYNHAQIGVVDADGNVNVIYPQTYGNDVVVEQKSNSYLTSNNITTMQSFAEIAGNDLTTVKELISTRNAGVHNALYRGVDLATRSWCGKNGDGTISSNGLTALCNRIANGSFDDLYVGDYFKTNITTEFGGSEQITCVLADFDTYYNCGDTALTKHHATIIVENGFKTAHAMNSTNTTGVSQNPDNPVGVSAPVESQKKGYLGSDMRQLVLPVYTAALKAVLGDHMITSRVLLDNDMNPNAVSAGYSGWNGASSNWEWVDSTLELMNENQVYGSAVGGDFYNTGIHKSQLSYLRLRPDRIGIRRSFWLRSVVTSGTFATVRLYGGADYYSASYALCVRPAYLLS